MKAKALKKIEKYDVRLNPELDRLLDLPIFLDRVAEADALISAVGMPLGLERRA